VNLPLIAVSSFRPLDENAEVAANQIRALRSWDAAFDAIYLFGQDDPRLRTKKTFFIESEPYTHISAMALVSCRTMAAACILNADIVVAPTLRHIAQMAWNKPAVAWTSKRAEFDPAKEDYDSAKVKDMGADIFCALPPVWERVWGSIPPGYRIGTPTWDSWMLGFLGLTYRRRFVDMTSLRPIFHPKHVERRRGTPSAELPRDKYITSGLGFPLLY
jgi:hypothetical protein